MGRVHRGGGGVGVLEAEENSILIHNFFRHVSPKWPCSDSQNDGCTHDCTRIIHAWNHSQFEPNRKSSGGSTVVF